MIFVTVGTQLPFDRLLQTLTFWASRQSEINIIAQVGQTNRVYAGIECHEKLSPIQFDDYVKQADLIVAHAGVGSILTAMRYCKPIVIFPRKAELGEHRNDHQLATVKHFQARQGVYVANGEVELASILDSLQALSAPVQISPYASDRLLARVGSFINSSSLNSDLHDSSLAESERVREVILPRPQPVNHEVDHR